MCLSTYRQRISGFICQGSVAVYSMLYSILLFRISAFCLSFLLTPTHQAITVTSYSSFSAGRPNQEPRPSIYGRTLNNILVQLVICTDSHLIFTLHPTNAQDGSAISVSPLPARSFPHQPYLNFPGISTIKFP